MKPVDYVQPVTFMQGNLVTQHLNITNFNAMYAIFTLYTQTVLYTNKVGPCVVGTVTLNAMLSVSESSIEMLPRLL